MKDLYNIFIVSLLLVTILSCKNDEFIEQTSPDQLPSENYWRNAEDAFSGLTAVYAQLEARSDFWGGWQEGRPVVEYYRSDYALPGPDATNYPHWMQIFNFNYTNGHTFLNTLWDTNYKGLFYANQVLNNVGKMTPEQISEAEKNQIFGEVSFLRGYYHFKLLSLFEQIIVRDELVTLEDLDKALSSRPETWDIIIEDFKKAATLLGSTSDSNDLGRATKGAALSYLGKAYLHKAGDPTSAATDDYTNAVTAFKEVVDSAVYSLEPDFLSIFNGENENNQESIFELQFKSGDATSWNATRLHAFIGDWSIEGWGGIEASTALVDEMKSEGMIAADGLYDHRLYGSVYFRDPYFNDISTNEMQGSTWDVLMNDQYNDTYDNHAYFRKWLPNYVRDNKFIGLNVVLMRYADVLLMYAEALNETGDTSQAIDIIDNIRDIHGNMPAITATTQADVKTQIIHERTMELTLESTRFFDLRRWGMLDQAMQAAGRTGFSASSHSYFPVPLSEINSNSLID